MSRSSKPSAKDIRQFMSVTGAKRNVAVSMLEACGGNLELAISMHIENGSDDVTEQPVGAAVASSHSTGRRANGTENGFVTPTVPVDEDGIRAPIASKQEVLVDGPGLVLPARRRARNAPHNPFHNMRDFAAEGLLGGDAEPRAVTARTLSRLFQPPVDIMFRGSLDAAKSAGVSDGKWILVDLHDHQEFECQKLNRDLWRNNAVRRLIEDNFVFWQVQADSIDGNRYKQFYPTESCPHVAFLDPRTGERLEHCGFIEAKEFCVMVQDFLSRHALPIRGLECEAESQLVARSSANCAKADLSRSHHRAKRGDDDEAAMLASAIAASLSTSNAATGGSESTMSPLTDDDDDEDYDDAGDSPMVVGPRRSTRNVRVVISDDDDDGGGIENCAGDGGMLTRSRARPLRKRKLTDQSLSSPDEDGSGRESESVAHRHNVSHKAKRVKRQMTDSSVNSAACALAATSVSDDDRINISSSVSAGSSPGVAQHMANGHVVTGDSGKVSASSVPAPDWSSTTDVPAARLLLRLPDGSREKCFPPITATVESIFQYTASLGYPHPNFSLIFPFPRRDLNDIARETNIKDTELWPSGTLCLEEV